MLPSVVLTRLNGVQLAARLPAPVAIGRCEQPAFSTAGQQDRPSLTTLLPGSRSRLASFSTSLFRKPLTTLSRIRLGLRSGVVSTAATTGVLPAALAALALAAGVGVVDLDPARELRLRGL